MLNRLRSHKLHKYWQSLYLRTARLQFS